MSVLRPFLVAAMALFPSWVLAAQPYEIVDLGPSFQGYLLNDSGQVVGFVEGLHERVAFLYDGTDFVDVGGVGWPIAINNSGQVLGQRDWQGRIYGLLYNGKQLIHVGSLGGKKTSPRALNNSGQVIGDSETADGKMHPFLFDGKKIIDLEMEVAGQCSVAAINDRGHVVGTFSAGGRRRMFLYDGEQRLDLGPLGVRGIVPVQVNNSGQMVIGWSRHLFFYDGKKTFDLGMPVRMWQSSREAVRLSEAGTVAGLSVSEKREIHAFFYDGKTKSDLGILNGNHTVTAINDSGLMVGWKRTGTKASNNTKDDFPPRHAFLFQDRKVIDLNELLSAHSGWALEAALAINKSGQILCAGAGHTFLLTPKKKGDAR